MKGDRCIAKWDAQTDAGPLHPLRMQVEEMSDGRLKITGGSIYPELSQYAVDKERRMLVWRPPSLLRAAVQVIVTEEDRRRPIPNRTPKGFS